MILSSNSERWIWKLPMLSTMDTLWNSSYAHALRTADQMTTEIYHFRTSGDFETITTCKQNKYGMNFIENKLSYPSMYVGSEGKLLAPEF